MRDGVLFGATHDRDDDAVDLREDDHRRNLEVLAKALPTLTARLEGASLGGRASIRAVTPDRLPLAGPTEAEGVYVLTGFGSRGFSLAPLLAEHVAALALGAPSPIGEGAAALLHPGRFALRAARRRKARRPALYTGCSGDFRGQRTFVMMFKHALPLALAGLLAGSAAAPQAAAKSPEEPKSQRQCFWTRQINNFASDDDRVVNVRVGVKDVYQFQMLGHCTDVDWNQKIAVRSRGSDYICTGLDAEIISPSTIGPQRCPVSTVRKLTPAEVAALPKRAKP
jgi:hypothetical protein